MKSILLIFLTLGLTACGGAGTPADSASAASALPDASEANTSPIRQNFVQACQQSALNSNPANANNPQKQAFAQTVSECVYDNGEQSYGGSSAWEQAIAQNEQQQSLDSKLQQTLQTALQQCVQQHAPKVQAASAVGASAASQ